MLVIKRISAVLVRARGSLLCSILYNFWFNFNALIELLLNPFSPVSYFYTPWKRQKIKGFLTFSGGIQMERWAKMG